MQKNQIELAGYLAAKPELRILKTGTKVANAHMAEGYRFIDKETKESKEHTNWHSLVFWGSLAEVAETFDKGDNLYVEGNLQTREVKPTDGSKKRTVHEVIVRTCHLIERPRSRFDAPALNDPGIGAYETAVDGSVSEGQSTGVKASDWPA